MKYDKKVFKWWWSWRADKMENYLEEMAKKGWRLVEVSFGMMIFKFVKDESETIRYAFDYKKEITDEYTTIIKDDGWSLDYKIGDWLLWSKKYTDERPDLYTDNQSLIDRNNRILYFVGLICLLQLPLFFMLQTLFLTPDMVDWSHNERLLGSIILFAVYLPMLTISIIAGIRLMIENRRLRKESKG